MNQKIEKQLIISKIETSLSNKLISDLDSLSLDNYSSYLIDIEQFPDYENEAMQMAVSDLTTALTSSNYWLLNSICHKIVDEYPSDSFNESIHKFLTSNATLECQELDNKKKYVKISYRTDIIILNAISFLKHDAINITNCYLQTKLFKLPLFMI
jgi:hypothetical protein